MSDTNTPDRSGSFAVFCATAERLGLRTTLRNIADVLAAGNRSVLLVDGRGTGAWASEPTPEPVRGQVATAHRPDIAGLLALASDPHALRYDHVLIGAPVPDTPEAPDVGRLASLADSLVACFAMTSWSIDGAAALAEHMRDSRAGGPARLLALGLKSNVEVHDRLRGARERVRSKFAPLAESSGAAVVPFLEIPYNPLYLDSRDLAVESEPEGSVAGIRTYYERLADWLRQRRQQPLTRVVLVHSSRHAPWAAWLEEQFGRIGIHTELQRDDTYVGDRPAPGTALLFLSPAGMAGGPLQHLAALSHPDVRIVLVDEPFPATRTAHHERIDLRLCAEEDAVRRLHASLGLGRVPPPDGSPGVLFPRLPELTNAPPRNGHFVDREEFLGRLNDALRTAGRSGDSLVLYGGSGWGKSETARELCHRYGPGYDTVWWVRSWEEPRARRGLERLAGRLGIVSSAHPAHGLTALLQHLSDPGAGSWLLVYDGAESPEELRELLPGPHERGHVLITSRKPPTAAGMVAFGHPAMSLSECHAVLSRYLPQIDSEQSEEIGHHLGFVPLALHLAARCLAERTATHLREDHTGEEAAARAAVEDLLAEWRTSKDTLLRRAGAASPVAVMVEVARRIAQGTPGAAAWRTESLAGDPLGWLLNASSLLTGRGMGFEILRSRRILSELAHGGEPGWAGAASSAGQPGPPGEVPLPDEHMVSVALWSLARVGLLDVDFDRHEQPLGQHHALRDLIRGGMDDGERARIEQVLRTVLAEFTPDEDRGLPADWAREVYSLQLWEDPRPGIRRSLLRHLNALSQRGESTDLARLLDISERAESAWRTAGDDPSREYLRLQNLTARAHRLKGSYEEARRLSEQALRGHRRLLGLVHPRTLLSADSHGAVLRSLGRFDDALVQARPVLDGLTLLLGAQHPATVQGEHNLALTEALSGRVTNALARLLDRIRYREAVGGEDDPAAWHSADLLACVYRMLGRNAESQELLRQWLRKYGGSWAGTRLNIEVGLAVSERRLAGGSRSAKEAQYGYEKAWERDQRALAEYSRRFGPDHLGTLRCRFSLAADLHALGKHGDAEAEALKCGRALVDTLGELHPFSGLGYVRHAVYLRATDQFEEAEATGRAALQILADGLGDAHPWVSFAENSLAATLAPTGGRDDGGDREEAAGLAHSALLRLQALGMGHRPDGRRVREHHDWLTGTGPAGEAPPGGFDIDLELPGL